MNCELYKSEIAKIDSVEDNRSDRFRERELAASAVELKGYPV